jgi:hypothetical protein
MLENSSEEEELFALPTKKMTIKQPNECAVEGPKQRDPKKLSLKEYESLSDTKTQQLNFRLQSASKSIERQEQDPYSMGTTKKLDTQTWKTAAQAEAHSLLGRKSHSRCCIQPIKI